MNAKTPIPTTIAMAIIFIALMIMAGGYALFYQGEKRFAQKDREYDILKEKMMHSEENYNDLKKKFDSNLEELKQVNNDYEITLQRHQECKEKQEELQTKYDTLQQRNEETKKALVDAQSKLGISTENTNPHPVSMLNKESTNINENCPSPDIVTKNASAGAWKDDKMSWWVDFTKRPLNESENIKDLFKILYDGQSIACYYALAPDGDNVWIVVKGTSKDKKTLALEGNGWAPCPTNECKSICEKNNLKQCTFLMQ